MGSRCGRSALDCCGSSGHLVRHEVIIEVLPTIMVENLGPFGSNNSRLRKHRPNQLRDLGLRFALYRRHRLRVGIRFDFELRGATVAGWS